MNSLLTWSAPVRDRWDRLTMALDGLGLLALRLFAGQEFLLAGWTKLAYGTHAPDWFAGLSFPAPLHLLSPDLNWLAAGLGETLFGAALLLGLGGRLAAVALLFITWVAVYTVHFDLGWAGWNQIDTDGGLGFKVPLMLAVMLLVVLTQGSGRYSLDTLCRQRQPTHLLHPHARHG